MADTFDLKIGLEGEKKFKKALAEINQFSQNDKSVESLTARNQVLNKEIEALLEIITSCRG